MACRRGLQPSRGSGLPCRCRGASAQPEEGCSGVSPRVALLQTPWLLDGWVMGVSGSNPEHVLHRPSPADVLEAAAFQQLLPHASPCERLGGGTVETYFERVTDMAVKSKGIDLIVFSASAR